MRLGAGVRRPILAKGLADTFLLKTNVLSEIRGTIQTWRNLRKDGLIHLAA